MKDLYGFKDKKTGLREKPAKWMSLVADPYYKAVGEKEYPGSVLVKAGLGTKEMAEACPWKPPAAEPRTKWYQFNAHIYQATGLMAADSNGSVDPYFKVIVMIVA